MAKGLMEYGAEAVIWGTSEKVKTIAEEFRSRGFICQGVVANLADRTSLNAAFSESMELLGN